MRRNKGITLIALVITIIVLLILAGVAIAMLSGENGILKKAAEAKTQTEQKSTEEQIKLAATSARTNTNNSIESKATLERELKQQGLNDAIVTEVDGGYKVIAKGITQIVTNNGKVRYESGVEKNIDVEIKGNKATLADENGEIIVVPVGFKIKADSPKVVKKGIVVVAPDGSEFVWVPVKDVNKMYGTNKDGKKLGKFYKFTKTGYSEKNWTETEGVMSLTNTSGEREPDYLSSTSSGDAVTGNDTKGIGLLKSIVKIDGTTDEEILNKWKAQLQNEFDEMIKYVGNNKGFYVGRYETSLNSSSNAQSKLGFYSATDKSNSAKTWYGLYQKEKEYSEKNNLTDIVGSSMIWGSQYHQMLIWMQENGIDVVSNNPKNSEGITMATNKTRYTGTESKDKVNSIYDLMGNSIELTLGAYDSNSRIKYGANYTTTYTHLSSQSNVYNYPHNTGGSYGQSSRITLYIK